jgi:tRNA-specific 2-thiouridylase
MSGGVDSSTTAALLKREGHDVIGVGLRLPIAGRGAEAHKRSCCDASGMEDARRVAASIGIPFRALDYRKVFEEEVIDGFCKAYLAGRTPNPCVDCNRTMKFGHLLKLAETLGADRLATGHYARTSIDPASGRALLMKGVDASRDQSYFLYALSQQQLAKALFPLGDMTKDNVRALAKSLGLHVSAKPGSQDICFLAGGDYRRVIAERFPEAVQPGPIISTSGKNLGEHKGTIHFTIGQRHGLKIAAPEPLYVVAIDGAKRTVIVGNKGETFRSTLTVSNLNWIAFEKPPRTLTADVRIRHRQPLTPAALSVRDDGTVHVQFERPVHAVAPGQSAVFYEDDLVLGGGVIVT